MCVCLYYQQSCAYVWRKVKHLVPTFDFYTSVHQHYWTRYRLAFQSSCAQLECSQSEKLLQLTRTALLPVLLFLERSANLQNASSPGKPQQSRRLVDCLYVTRMTFPKRNHLQLLAPSLLQPYEGIQFILLGKICSYKEISPTIWGKFQWERYGSTFMF